MKETNTFQTKDLSLAACLVTNKIKLNEIVIGFVGLKNRPIGTFLFDESTKCKEIENNYFNGVAMVSAREFASNVNMLKASVMNLASSSLSDMDKSYSSVLNDINKKEA